MKIATPYILGKLLWAFIFHFTVLCIQYTPHQSLPPSQSKHTCNAVQLTIMMLIIISHKMGDYKNLIAK